MPRKQKYILILDVVSGGISYYLAFVLRFSSFAFPSGEFLLFLKTLPVVLLIKFIAFNYFGLHRPIWKYTSTQEVIGILKSSGFATLSIIFVIFTLSRGEGFPRSVLIIDWLITVAFVGGIRFIMKMKGETKISFSRSIRVLVVGAGNAGTSILKEMKNNPKIGYNPIGFIDDDPAKQGRTIYGISILGTQADIPRLVYRHGIQEVVITIPSASGNEMRSIVAQCRAAKVKFKTLPAFAAIINGSVSLSQIKDVDVIDLLRRDPIELDTTFVSIHLSNRKIMVTGAGGSIGGELCRQIARFNPSELILVDMAETPLFWIELSLKSRFPNLKVTSFLEDITDAQFIEEIISKTLPQIIYHTAAYKHVPIVEKNALQGIRNNIFGTQILSELAKKYAVETFVMISTDKAVNPKNFMGVSKRVNELYIQALAKESKTKFVSVRFGNVLDSNGSCVPIFKQQIKEGKPITITHPDAKRFFMTLPEASQLILQAGSMGKGGEIFILKMGEQIRIVDLARDIIAFSGEDADKAEFSFIGLRPGEKLEEKLVGNNEKAQLTNDEKILIVNSNNNVSYIEIKKEFGELSELVKSRNTANAIKKCESIISTYS